MQGKRDFITGLQAFLRCTVMMVLLPRVLEGRYYGDPTTL